MTSYYMRDNHTFKRLHPVPEIAVMQIEREFGEGWTYGTLFCRERNVEVHAYGEKDMDRFIAECAKALTELSANTGLSGTGRRSNNMETKCPRGPLEPIVRRLCDEHGGLRAAARALKISAPYLSRLATGNKAHPSDAVLKKLGIRKEVTYVR